VTKLSPAARAVLEAVTWKKYDVPPEGLPAFAEEMASLLAAALRATADQVVPKEDLPPRRGVRPGGTDAITPDEGAEDQRAATRRKILAIATELEGSQ